MSDLLTALLQQAENEQEKAVMLSKGSMAVLLYALSQIEAKSAWINKRDNPLDTLTDEEWDEAEKLIANAAYDLMGKYIVQYPTHTMVSMLTPGMVVTNNTFTQSPLNAVLWGFYGWHQTAANGQSVQTTMHLAAGLYNVYFWGQRSTNRAKLDWYLDGALVIEGQDWYFNGTSAAPLFTQITVPTDGNHMLKYVVNGKNAASSNYYMLLTAVEFCPVLDMGGA